MEIKLTDKLNNIIEFVTPKDKSTQLALTVGILALGVLLPAALLTAAFIAKAIKITVIVIILACAYFAFSGEGPSMAFFSKWAKPEESTSSLEIGSIATESSQKPLSISDEMRKKYKELHTSSPSTPSSQAIPSLEKLYEDSPLSKPNNPTINLQRSYDYD